MKTMKSINLIIAAVTLCVLVSCSGFLDKTPTDVVDTDTAMTDDMAIALTTACYRALQSSNMYNQRLWTLDIVAGNSEVGAGGGTDGIETIQAADFITQSDNGMALYMWRSPWVGIGQCNIVLTSLPGAKDVSDEVRDRCMGEAYFLRSHYYYVLVRLFGGVPLRLEPYNPGDDAAIARSTVDETYDQIISDCTAAINLLPVKASYDSENVGRACREAAMAMLADIYLTLAPKHADYYRDAVDLCDAIADLGYDLTNCKYEDNFDATVNNSPESLFEVQYSGSTEYDFWGNNPQSSWLSVFMGPRNADFVGGGGYGWNLPTEEFVEQYEDGDLRKDVTILYSGCPEFDGNIYKSSYSSTGYNVRKFLVPKSISPEYNTSPANFVVYRYADVLLMKAEALNEEGDVSAAAVPLNIVRARAGLPAVSGLGQDEMREKIIHERRMELAFEGHRWFDLIRLQDGDYAISFLQSVGKGNVNKNRLLFPIPQTEMDANSLMEQNPGY